MPLPKAGSTAVRQRLAKSAVAQVQQDPLCHQQHLHQPAAGDEYGEISVTMRTVFHHRVLIPKLGDTDHHALQPSLIDELQEALPSRGSAFLKSRDLSGESCLIYNSNLGGNDGVDCFMGDTALSCCLMAERITRRPITQQRQFCRRRESLCLLLKVQRAAAA